MLISFDIFSFQSSWNSQCPGLHKTSRPESCHLEQERTILDHCGIGYQFCKGDAGDERETVSSRHPLNLLLAGVETAL